MTVITAMAPILKEFLSGAIIEAAQIYQGLAKIHLIECAILWSLLISTKYKKQVSQNSGCKDLLEDVMVMEIHVMINAMLGAALEISLRKNIFKHFFFSMQTCRYGVSYEISSRQISKEVIFFSCFVLVLLGKMRFWMVFLLFSLLFGHLCGIQTPPFLQALQGTHHVCKFFYSLLYQMK